MSEHLKAAGFATAALVSNISAGPKFGFNQGWQDFEKTDNAQHAFARALTWLDARDTKKPFFLYVQTIDPHVPFSISDGSAEIVYGGPYTGKLGPSFEQSEEDALNDGSLKLNEEDARWLRALYDAEVLYHDYYLGTFVQGLRERGILQDTAFVILNDHGEEFGEKGRWGHGWTMGDALHRSPLLMHFPGYFPAETIGSVVEHVDVAPTIVASLQQPPMNAAEGTNLLPLLHSEVHPGLRSALLFGRPKRRATRVGDFKLVLQGTQKAALYNLAKDPVEATDILSSHAVAQRLCEVAMGEAIANPNKAHRLEDRSEPLKIRAQYISE
jgi:arylsulfatase A-like enzyme